MQNENEFFFEIRTSFDDNAAAGKEGDAVSVCKWNGTDMHVIAMIGAAMNSSPEVAIIIMTAAQLFMNDQGPKAETINTGIK